MDNALHKMLGRMLMICLFFIAPCLVFSHFRKMHESSLAVGAAEKLIQEVSKDGILTAEEYLSFESAFQGLSGTHEVEFLHSTYVEQPYYGYYTASEHNEYYRMRNRKTIRNIGTEEIEVIEEDATELVYSDVTNASVLAGSSGIMLPVDGVPAAAPVYAALVPEQVLYEAEPAVTAASVSYAGFSYVTMLDSIFFPSAGTYQVELMKDGWGTGAYIEVSVYPRTMSCAAGHEFVFKKEQVKEFHENGTVPTCPYCSVMVKDIVAVTGVVNTTCGTEFKTLPLTLAVTYHDGHVENIQPSSVEGLVSDYDSNYCGEQKISVSYRGFTKKEVARVVSEGEPCMECGAVCRNRCHSDYENTPYCDGCLSGIPSWNGITYKQKTEYGTEVVMEALRTEGSYLFSRGDIFSVTIKSRESRILSRLLVSAGKNIVKSGVVRTGGRRD